LQNTGLEMHLYACAKKGDFIIISHDDNSNNIIKRRRNQFRYTEYKDNTHNNGKVPALSNILSDGRTNIISIKNDFLNKKQKQQY
jgi:hypothetical protein